MTDRQGQPGARYRTSEGLLVADDEGLIRIRTQAQARIADAFHLPPARPKAKAKETD